MLIQLVICAATVFVLCAWYFERRHKALEARMTEQVKERYAAYIELEERVRAALGEFDRLESTFEAEVRKSREQIRSLEDALNTVEGIESVEPETPGGFLGVLDEGDANVQAMPVTLTGAPRDFEAELQTWERRVEAAQTEKCIEIERQRAQIAELTARVRQLEPTATAHRQRGEALPSTGAVHGAAVPGDLEQRIEQAGHSARDLVVGLENFLRASRDGITSLGETLASCKPLLAQQAEDRARAVELESQRTELAQSCAVLEERCSALDDNLRSREKQVEHAQAAAAECEERLVEGARRLATTNQELTSVRLELESERQRLERESIAREELERAREALVRSTAQLKTRLEEEGERNAGLGEELEGARARLEQHEEQYKELEARGREQNAVLQAQTDMLQVREEEIGRLRARVGALETKLVSTRDTIGGQKSRLVELMEAIQVTQKEQDRHKAILSEQSAHMEEARSLLEQLRPVMDTLEGELDRKQTS
jgi:chromosome segregation ATPase